MTIALQCWIAVRTSALAARDRLAEEAGEGVISTAIAVLIVALLGAGMWLAFQELFTDVNEQVKSTVEDIK